MNGKKRSVVVAASELELLQAKALVCDSYIRTLAASDTRAARAQLHQALGAMSRLKAAQQRDEHVGALDTASTRWPH